MLTDAGGLGLALFAIWVAARPPHPGQDLRLLPGEILAALVNAIVLLVVAGGILVDDVSPACLAPPEILGGPMLGSPTGTRRDLVCARLLHHAAGHSLNVGQRTSSARDRLSSAGVGGRRAGRRRHGLDAGRPARERRDRARIVPRTWPLRQAVNVLLEGTPAHLDLGEIEVAILRVPGVRRVHDLHVGTLTSGREAMSAHVSSPDVREKRAAARGPSRPSSRALRHRPHQIQLERAAGGVRIQGPTAAPGS